ncbi:hypothetical protein AVP_28 [Aerococcus phage vB_AviM_AVP]|nr:hypothetical protein AVP_28 [Aerococcus phage vB_AviM_AVP]
MNTQDEIKELKKRIAELEEQVEQEKEFPQDGDKYWLIEETLGVSRYAWAGDDFDNKLLSVGNVFRTKEQAEFAVEKLKVEAELRKYSRPFKNGWDNYNIILTDNESVNTAYWSGVQSQGSIHFESRDKAQQAIESVGEDRIKKYIFGVED